VVVEPSTTSRTARNLLGITLAGLLAIEEHKEAQAFPLPSYGAPDAVSTLAQELGGFLWHKVHVDHHTQTGVRAC
jgi:hypothetical protein